MRVTEIPWLRFPAFAAGVAAPLQKTDRGPLALGQFSRRAAGAPLRKLERCAGLPLPKFSAPDAVRLKIWTAAPAPPRLRSQTQLPVSSTGRGRCVCPWGQNLPQNHALGLAASHTLCGKFPCRCPSRTHMSSGWDFFWFHQMLHSPAVRSKKYTFLNTPKGPVYCFKWIAARRFFWYNFT